LKSLKEYNKLFAEKFKKHKEKQLAAGVLCPECVTELIYDPEIYSSGLSQYVFYYKDNLGMFLSCPVCGFKGEKMEHSAIKIGEENE
jgi:hypothetical protein